MAPISLTSSVHSSADISRLVELFGQSMYSRKLPDVVVKELVQNARDAINIAYERGKLTKGKGQIDIQYDSVNRLITVTDNGNGMTPDIIQNAFLRIAGTDKNGLSLGERSGGFGLAKLAFLFAAERVGVRTIRDGICSHFQASGSELLNQAPIPLKLERTTEANGTIVRIKLPEILPGPNGKDIHILIPTKLDPLGFLSKPLIGNLKMTVQFNEKTVQELPVYRSARDIPLPFLTTVKTEWADVDVYLADQTAQKSRNSTIPDQYVLSSGLFQFDQMVNTTNGRSPYDVWMNVKPRVDAANIVYPFGKQREGWSAKVAMDVDLLHDLISMIGHARSDRALSRSFEDLKVFTPPMDGKPVGLQNIQDVTALHANRSVVNSGDRVEIKDGRLTVNGTLLIERQQGITGLNTVKQSPGYVRPAPLTVDCSHIFFRSTLDTDIVTTASEQAGQSPDAMKMFLYNLGTEIKAFGKALSLIRGYEAFAPEKNERVLGVMLQKGLRGEYIKIPVRGLFLNPAAFHEKTPSGVAHGLLHVLMHEAIHEQEMGHNDSFTTHMSNLYGAMEDANEGFYGQALHRLTGLVTQNWPLFEALRKAHNDPAVKNVDFSAQDDTPAPTAGGRIDHPAPASGIPATAEDGAGNAAGDQQPDHCARGWAPNRRIASWIGRRLNKKGPEPR